jgi:hypothetical protein
MKWVSVIWALSSAAGVVLSIRLKFRFLCLIQRWLLYHYKSEGLHDQSSGIYPAQLMEKN